MRSAPRKLETIGFNSHLHVFETKRPIQLYLYAWIPLNFSINHLFKLNYSISNAKHFVRLKNLLISKSSLGNWAYEYLNCKNNLSILQSLTSVDKVSLTIVFIPPFFGALYIAMPYESS